MEQSADDTKSGLIDVSDYSLSDIFLLQLILQKEEPVNRHNLYVELDQFFDRQKNISTSTFYNSLKKMERDGLITMSKDKRPNVRATSKLQSTLSEISQYFMTQMFNFSGFEELMFATIMQHLPQRLLKRILLVDTSHYIDLHVMKFLSNTPGVESLSLLTNPQSYEKFEKMEFGIDLFHVEFRNEKIRAPEEDYDVAVFFSYMRIPQTPTHDRKELLREVFRVLNPEGMIVSVSLSPLPQINHALLSGVIQEFNQIVSHRVMSKEMLENDMVEHTSKVKIIDFQGILIGIIEKE